MGTTVLNFVIVGHEDHPIHEADLSVRDPVAKEERAQYLHQVSVLVTQGLKSCSSPALGPDDPSVAVCAPRSS